MRCTIALLAWLASNMLALGGETGRLADVTSAMAPILANLRTAASYARTGNVALAQIETDEAVARWKQLVPNRNPLPADAPAELAGFLDRGRDRLMMIAAALDRGDDAAAGRELLALRQAFHALRRHAGLYDLGDCIFEIAPAMETLRAAAIRYGGQPAPANAEETVAAASAFRDRLQRCNEWANGEIAAQGEFRRLIDGAITSSGEIAHAAMAGDGSLVNRYLIELQSFAQLLDFRYG
ncbi:hypothetical protein [Bradyrhizobium guangxiense]|uniref:hypothetical protein n=1 Tax=Bradyrhizobium guangxiense TaxID=1325115 RepID=UPI0013E8AF37|nr:hypothetical protein [Bradyrhizobium guangxiense]